MIKYTLTEFLNFIKKPTDTQWNINFWEKLKVVFILLIAEVILFWIVIYPIDIIIDSYFVNLKPLRLEYDYTIGFQFFMLVVFAPLIEELMFRWVLRRQGLIHSLVTQKEWDKAFPYLVYITAILFGFVHMSNYTNDETIFYILSPIILGSQLMGGFIISFIRVRFNILWGMLYHALWNFSVVFLITLTWGQFQPPYQDKTEHYEIEISESPFFNDEKKQVLKIDSTNGKIHKMEVEQYTFRHLLDTLYQKDKYYVDDSFIQLKFNSKKGVSKEEFLEILKKEYDIE
ncbi:MAG: CPBP family intramembrane metalloprotease [Flavobacteriaceae bacterium]|nr:CPBP family intramembrane metalloprotease [Flavobacteriaceae bacterium]